VFYILKLAIHRASLVYSIVLPMWVASGKGIMRNASNTGNSAILL